MNRAMAFDSVRSDEPQIQSMVSLDQVNTIFSKRFLLLTVHLTPGFKNIGLKSGFSKPKVSGHH